MNRYEGKWLGWDHGREGFRPLGPLWLGVLSILARHEGEDYYQRNSAVYEDLERAYPEETWVNDQPRRQAFRAYGSAWTDTGVLVKRTRKRPGISLTPLGRAVVNGRVSQGAAILNAAAHHREMFAPERSENPFAILAEAFLAFARESAGDVPLTLDDLYFGVQCNWRPGDGSLTTALGQADRGQLPATPRRRLRAILKVLTELGGIEEVSGGWLLRSGEILLAIVNKTTVDEVELARAVSPVIPPAPSVLTAEEQEVIASGEFDAATTDEVRRKVLRAIWVRRGQPQFRKTLLPLYSNRCAISGYDAEEALEAAHVIPVAVAGTHSPRNGLILRADLHTLFDLHLLAIDPASHSVVIGDTLRPTVYNRYHGAAASMPIALLDRPSDVNLRTHLQNLR